MGFNLDAFLTQSEHTVENHDGLPGVGNLDSSVGPAGTVNHSLLNHAGIPGISSSNATVLAPGITIPGDINTALTNFDIVYLKIGNYGTLASSIQVPDSKQLICLTAGSDQGPTSTGAEMARFTISTNTRALNIFDNCVVTGIHITASGANTQPIIQCNSGNGYRTLRQITIDMSNSWLGPGIDAQLCMGHFENIRITNIPIANANFAFRQTQPTSGTVQMNIYRGILIKGNPGLTNGTGIQAFGPGIMENCGVFDRGTGIVTGNAGSQGASWVVRDCHVQDIRLGNGIDLLSLGGIANCHHNTVLNCIAGVGIRWSFAGVGNNGILGPNRSSGNLTNYLIGTAFINHFNV